MTRHVTNPAMLHMAGLLTCVAMLHMATQEACTTWLKPRDRPRGIPMYKSRKGGA